MLKHDWHFLFPWLSLQRPPSPSPLPPGKGPRQRCWHWCSDRDLGGPLVWRHRAGGWWRSRSRQEASRCSVWTSAPTRRLSGDYQPADTVSVYSVAAMVTFLTTKTKKWVGWQVKKTKKQLELIMLASPNTGHCVAMVICPVESYLNLASGAGSGHFQTGTRWEGALRLSPPITAPVVYTKTAESQMTRDTHTMTGLSNNVMTNDHSLNVGRLKKNKKTCWLWFNSIFSVTHTAPQIRFNLLCFNITLITPLIFRFKIWDLIWITILVNINTVYTFPNPFPFSVAFNFHSTTF